MSTFEKATRIKSNTAATYTSQRSHYNPLKNVTNLQSQQQSQRSESCSAVNERGKVSINSIDRKKSSIASKEIKGGTGTQQVEVSIKCTGHPDCCLQALSLANDQIALRSNKEWSKPSPLGGEKFDEKENTYNFKVDVPTLHSKPRLTQTTSSVSVTPKSFSSIAPSTSMSSKTISHSQHILPTTTSTNLFPPSRSPQLNRSGSTENNSSIKQQCFGCDKRRDRRRNTISVAARTDRKPLSETQNLYQRKNRVTSITTAPKHAFSYKQSHLLQSSKLSASAQDIHYDDRQNNEETPKQPKPARKSGVIVKQEFARRIDQLPSKEEPLRQQKNPFVYSISYAEGYAIDNQATPASCTYNWLKDSQAPSTTHNRRNAKDEKGLPLDLLSMTGGHLYSFADGQIRSPASQNYSLQLSPASAISPRNTITGGEQLKDAGNFTDSLSKVVAHYEDRIKTIDEHNQATIKSYKALLANLGEECIAARKDKDEMMESQRELVQDLQEQQDAIEQLETELSRMKAHIDASVKMSPQSPSSDSAEKKEESDESETTGRGFKEYFNTFIEKFSQLKTTSESVTRIVETARRGLQQQQQYGGGDGDSDNCRQRYSRRVSVYDTPLGTVRATYEQEIRMQTTIITQLKQAESVLLSRVHSLEEEVTQLGKQRAKQLSEENMEQVKNLQRMNEGIEVEKDKQRRQLLACQQEISLLNQQNEELRNGVEEFQNEISEMTQLFRAAVETERNLVVAYYEERLTDIARTMDVGSQSNRMVHCFSITEQKKVLDEDKHNASFNAGQGLNASGSATNPTDLSMRSTRLMKAADNSSDKTCSALKSAVKGYLEQSSTQVSIKRKASGFTFEEYLSQHGNHQIVEESGKQDGYVRRLLIDQSDRIF